MVAYLVPCTQSAAFCQVCRLSIQAQAQKDQVQWNRVAPNSVGAREKFLVSDEPFRTAVPRKQRGGGLVTGVKRHIDLAHAVLVGERRRGRPQTYGTSTVQRWAVQQNLQRKNYIFR